MSKNSRMQKRFHKIFVTALTNRMANRYPRQRPLPAFSGFMVPKSPYLKKPDILLKVYLVSPVTGEKLTGTILGTSFKKLNQEFSSVYVRTIVQNIIILKKTSLYNLTKEEWERYPLMLIVGKVKHPFVIGRLDLKDVGSHRTANFCLETIDNISYLEAIGIKKRLLAQAKVAPSAKKAKTKKRRKK